MGNDGHISDVGRLIHERTDLICCQPYWLGRDLLVYKLTHTSSTVKLQRTKVLADDSFCWRNLHL